MDDVLSKLGAPDYATRREARKSLMMSNEDVVPSSDLRTDGTRIGKSARIALNLWITLRMKGVWPLSPRRLRIR